MHGVPAPVPDERSGLFAFLDHQRQLVRVMAFGLTDEQARSTPSASELSVGGIIKHLAMTERSWTARTVGNPWPPDPEKYQRGFVMDADETLADLLEDYAAAGRETDEALGALDLDHPVPVGSQPWFPQEWKAWSVRWVLLHLIEETARHCGHIDIIRETVDGGTWYALMAAESGEPPAPWIKPWTPKDAPARD
jgi:uncharacterized damage-inducible protein DinB